jgi:hypothetical protein
VARNLSHACGDYSVARFLASKSDHGRDLFERFVALIRNCGAYQVAPAKTRVAFMVAVRFASVNRVADRFIDVHFVLPRELASSRFRKVERVDSVYVHHLRLTDPRDFDRELGAWLLASYVEYGERRWLANRASNERSKGLR